MYGSMVQRKKKIDQRFREVRCLYFFELPDLGLFGFETKLEDMKARGLGGTLRSRNDNSRGHLFRH